MFSYDELVVLNTIRKWKIGAGQNRCVWYMLQAGCSCFLLDHCLCFFASTYVEDYGTCSCNQHFSLLALSSCYMKVFIHHPSFTLFANSLQRCSKCLLVPRTTRASSPHALLQHGILVDLNAAGGNLLPPNMLFQIDRTMRYLSGHSRNRNETKERSYASPSPRRWDHGTETRTREAGRISAEEVLWVHDDRALWD